MSGPPKKSFRQECCLNIVRHWTVSLLWTLIISGKSRRNPHLLSISSPRYCQNGKCLFIHWRRWLPLRHRRTKAFVYHPNFLIYGVEYLHFRSRDSTCRRWYRHFRRRDLLLFTCAGGGEVGACVLALGGCSLSQLWRTRLGCHLGLGRGLLHNSGLILPLIHDPCSWINPPCVGTWTVVVLFYSFFYIT